MSEPSLSAWLHTRPRGKNDFFFCSTRKILIIYLCFETTRAELLEACAKMAFHLVHELYRESETRISTRLRGTCVRFSFIFEKYYSINLFQMAALY